MKYIMKICSNNIYEEYEFAHNSKNNIRWYDFALMLLFAILPVMAAYCAYSINYCVHYEYYGENGDWDNPIEVYLTPFYYGVIRFIYPFNIEPGVYNVGMSIYFIACGLAVSLALIHIYCKNRFREDNKSFRTEFATMAAMDALKATAILTIIVVLNVFSILLSGSIGPNGLIDLCIIIITLIVLILRYFIYYRIYKLTEYERA